MFETQKEFKSQFYDIPGKPGFVRFNVFKSGDPDNKDNCFKVEEWKNSNIGGCIHEDHTKKHTNDSIDGKNHHTRIQNDSVVEDNDSGNKEDRDPSSTQSYHIPQEVHEFFKHETTPSPLERFIDPHGFLLSNLIKGKYGDEMTLHENHPYVMFSKVIASYWTGVAYDRISASNVTTEATKATTAYGFNIHMNGNDEAPVVKLSSDFAFVLKLNWRAELYDNITRRWWGQSKDNNSSINDNNSSNNNNNKSWIPHHELEEELQKSYIIAKPSNDERHDMRSTEFRYSFAHIERKLISLQSSTQRKIYLIFKTLFYRWVKPLDPDRLSSYICKCSMLWVTEQLSPNHTLWSDDPDSQLAALSLLLRQLLSYFEGRYMPYYFVPSINVLQQLPEHTTLQVVLILKKILADPLSFLCVEQIEKVKEYMHAAHYLLVKSMHLVDQFQSSSARYLFYFERPDLFALVKNYIDDRKKRKEINESKVKSPFDDDLKSGLDNKLGNSGGVNSDRQCLSTELPLRYRIFGENFVE